MKRINIGAIHPGDIVLTASKSAAGKGIRATTLAVVSHAMICVQHGSVIDSTGDGVQARNLQRELFKPFKPFKPFKRVYAFRLREPLDPERLEQVINFARSEVGTRYSVREGVRSVLPGTAANITAVQGTLRQSRNMPFKYAGVGVFTGLPVRHLSAGSDWVQ